MDDLDHKILQLLAENARMPVKDIAQQISLTSPAVSSRIHRLEQEGVIGGYTVVLRHPDAPARVEALISVLVDAATRASFLSMIEQEPQVLQCFRVTGNYNFIIKVSCTDIDALEHLLTKMQPEERIPAMSQADTTITMLLFAIPLVGLILALVWSFGGTDNPARKRLARSYLIRTLVVIAVVALFVLVVSLVFSAVLHSQLAYSYYYMR